MKQCKTIGCIEAAKSSRALYCEMCRPTKKPREINPDFECAKEKSSFTTLVPAKRKTCAHKGCKRRAIKDNLYCGTHADLHGTREYKRPLSPSTFVEHTNAGKWLLRTVNRQRSLLPVKGYGLSELIELDEMISNRRKGAGFKGKTEKGQYIYETELHLGHLAPAIERTTKHVLVGSARPLNLQIMTAKQNHDMRNDAVRDEHGLAIHHAYEIREDEEGDYINAETLVNALGETIVTDFLKQHPSVKTDYETDSTPKEKRGLLGSCLLKEILRVSPYLSSFDAGRLMGRVFKLARKLRKAEILREQPEMSKKYREWVKKKERTELEQQQKLSDIRYKNETRAIFLKRKLLNEWELVMYLPRDGYV